MSEFSKINLFVSAYGRACVAARNEKVLTKFENIILKDKDVVENKTHKTHDFHKETKNIERQKIIRSLNRFEI